MPGAGVPIHSVEHLLADLPDDVVILTWDIADEVVAQLQRMRGRHRGPHGSTCLSRWPANSPSRTERATPRRTRRSTAAMTTGRAAAGLPWLASVLATSAEHRRADATQVC